MNLQGTIDLVCFSNLRWNFVYQRPQHLMSRFANYFRIIFIEPVAIGHFNSPFEINYPADNVITVTPHLPEGLSDEARVMLERERFAHVFSDLNIQHYFFWYYTPLVLPFTDGFRPLLKVYDCVSEYAVRKSSPPETQNLETSLLQQADLVFTAGQSLYERKKNQNQNTYCFPGSVDIDHFYNARYYTIDTEDQAQIPHPRIGFAGVIDERIDLMLLNAIALRKPEWHFIMLGPVVGINQKDLPKLPNIHFIGRKNYQDLPGYISGWDLTMLPFAHNDSTRYINPIQTPEFLAAGKPVIATPVIDVIRTYGHRGLVNIAGTSDEFARVGEMLLSRRDRTEWLENVTDFLSLNSWDKTWQRMMELTGTALQEKLQQPIRKHTDKICA
jgi:glycosyltransferase involved in cell wall biosynthesis